MVKAKVLFVCFCFFYRASHSTHLNKKQLYAQFIISILRQKRLHVSGVSTAHHQEVHRMDTTIGTYILFI
jgi:hypothetical protein